MLKCETNTDKIAKVILDATKTNFKYYQKELNRIHAVFEHGQWYVMFYDLIEDKERTFSVNDAEGIGAVNGFSFEEV